MKIKDVKVFRFSMPMKKPFKSSVRVLRTTVVVHVQIVTDIGIIGFGEAAPHLSVNGETVDSIEACIFRVFRPIIIGKNVLEFKRLIKDIQLSIYGNLSAKAAVEIAIFDLIGKYYNVSLRDFFGGGKDKLITDITVSLNDTAIMMKDVEEAISNGFHLLKIKLGKGIKEDFKTISSIRKSVGNDIELRVDPNQAWTSKESIYIIKKMEDAGMNISLVEQPVHYKDIKGLKKISNNVNTKIVADESCRNINEAMYLIENQIVDVINIKVMKMGGISNAVLVAKLADAYNIECMIGCTRESRLSLSASAHIASSHENIKYIDLDANSLNAIDPYIGGVEFDNSVIKIDGSFGNGIRDVKYAESLLEVIKYK